MAKEFITALTVDKSIVEILSRSTYQRHFSYALREMVSNAYDADATQVDITYDRRNRSLTINDNGSGMNRDEFSYYLRIAGKKRGKQDTAKFRRKRIGQFGVGFLAVFPFCNTLEVITSVENSDEILTASIPAADFFKRPSEHVNVEELEVKGLIYSDVKRRSEHFTTITLSGLTNLALSALSGVVARQPEQLRRRTASIRDSSPLERLKWELRDELPVAFPPGSPYRKIFRYPESELIRVTFNGEQLFRNDIMGDLLEQGILNVAGVKCKYAICTPWKPVKPKEMRWIKIRLKNVGVGVRTEFDATRTRAFSRISWLSGELHILEGLDDMLSVARDGFIESEPYQMLRQRMASILSKQAYEVESIEESSQEMTKHLGGAKQISVAAKREVVDRSVRKLEEKGFSVQKVKPKTGTHQVAVSVDRERRIVTVVEDHPSLRDEMIIQGIKYELVFSNFTGAGSDSIPCKMRGRHIIEVNTAFPLFKSKRYGELFKRVCSISLVASKRANTVDDMFNFIVDEMQQRFHDYE